MKIALAGTGNVATVLGRLFSRAGHNIVSVSGRNLAHAECLAKELGAKACSFAAIDDADIIIIAVSDGAIEDCAKEIIYKCPMVHTAGSVPSAVLRPFSEQHGVLYPLQSLRKEMEYLPEIPFLVNGSDETVTLVLEELCNSVPAQARRCDDESRRRIHLSAVIVSNFTNHLYALAEKFCNESNTDFSLLHPLIEETATRLKYASPSALQTGPAVRNDATTIDAHLQLLRDDERLREVYAFITNSIRFRLH